MHVEIHWGNILEVPHHTLNELQVSNIIEKNIQKISRFFKKMDESTIHLDFHLNYDAHKKRYKVIVSMTGPKSNYHITERGFSLEETVKGSVHNLRRKFRKDKERKITQRRKVAII